MSKHRIFSLGCIEEKKYFDVKPVLILFPKHKEFLWGIVGSQSRV